MSQPQSETLTRRDALAAGAVLLGATTFGTAVSADEPKSRRKLRIGVVGGGFGCAFQWHQHPDCVVTGVTDLRADRREALRKIYKCDQAYDSMEIMLQQARDVDAVAIFTEAPNHVRHCVAALNAGKHVICAVPAAVSLEECQLLVDTVKKTGLNYMMAETSYYQQATITARKWYSEGKFGDLFYCEAEYHHAGPMRPKPGSLAIDRNGVLIALVHDVCPNVEEWRWRTCFECRARFHWHSHQLAVRREVNDFIAPPWPSGLFSSVVRNLPLGETTRERDHIHF